MRSQTFAYDGAGNPTTWQGQTRTFNSNNQETTGGNFAYNGDGSPWKYLNRNLKTTQNPNGTPQVLSYNTAGQLRQINAVNSDGTTGAVQYKYAYRGDGKRAWKEDSNGNRTFFYYDGEAMLAYSGEADFSARLVLWEPDGVVGQQWRNSNNTTGSQYFLYDAQGNLAQTIGGDGAVSGSIYAFTAWGESVKNADGTVNTPGGFGYGAQFGYFRDGETGFYLCTYRHYDPSAGRWITRDPIEYGGGPNLYGYVMNDPANGIDPSGLATDPAPGSGKFRLVFNAFIPTPVVDAPIFNNPILGTAFGDNRGFSSTGGTYRVMHTAVINPVTGQSRGWHNIGASSATNGATGTQTDYSSLQTYVSGNCKTGWKIHIEGNPRYPLFPIQAITPGITYRMGFTISPQGRISGNITHDNYPAYEVWLYTGKNNAQMLHGHAPRTTIGSANTGLGLAMPEFFGWWPYP